MLATNKEVLLILSKTLDLSWETTMALLFLGAPDHRISAKDLEGLKEEFSQWDVHTSNEVLKHYRSRSESAHGSLRRLPQLHSV